MVSTPEDKGPSSQRVAKLDVNNPIHIGLLKSKDNPNTKVRYGKDGFNVHMAVAPGMEAEPKPSTRFPSTNTPSVPYKYEGPEPTYASKEKPKKIAAKPAPKKMSNLEKAQARELEAKRKGII
jgi:hypothetical protein